MRPKIDADDGGEGDGSGSAAGEQSLTEGVGIDERGDRPGRGIGPLLRVLDDVGHRSLSLSDWVPADEARHPDTVGASSRPTP